MVGAMVGYLTSAAEEPRNVYKVGLNTTRLLLSLGDLVIGWLLLRQAEVALTRLGSGAGAARRGLLHGQGRGGAVLRRARGCRCSPPNAPSPRRPTSTSWTSTRLPSSNSDTRR